MYSCSSTRSHTAGDPSQQSQLCPSRPAVAILGSAGSWCRPGQRLRPVLRDCRPAVVELARSGQLSNCRRSVEHNRAQTPGPAAARGPLRPAVCLQHACTSWPTAQLAPAGARSPRQTCPAPSPPAHPASACRGSKAGESCRGLVADAAAGRLRPAVPLPTRSSVPPQSRPPADHHQAHDTRRVELAVEGLDTAGGAVGGGRALLGKHKAEQGRLHRPRRLASARGARCRLFGSGCSICLQNRQHRHATAPPNRLSSSPAPSPPHFPRP